MFDTFNAVYLTIIYKVFSLFKYRVKIIDQILPNTSYSQLVYTYVVL